jgi:pimeloyl-ACP methyl ester carboxylesterase
MAWGRTQWLKTAYKELVVFKECADQIRVRQHAYAHLPLIVLSQRLPTKSSSRAEKRIAHKWQELQQDLANQSSQGQKILAKHSGHCIQLDQPELVIEAIKSIFQAAMAGGRRC